MDFNEVGSPGFPDSSSQWPGKANLGQPCWGGGTEGTLPQQPGVEVGEGIHGWGTAMGRAAECELGAGWV